MNCQDVASLTTRYLSGELDRVRASDFDTHLKDCPGCFYELARYARAEAASHESALGEVTGVPSVDWGSRDHFAEELASVNRRDGRQHKPMPRLRVIAVMGAAAVLLVVALGYRVLMGPGVTRVYANAARDHQQEVVGQHSRKWLSDPRDIVALAERRGIPGTAVLALASQGYQLERGRLCLLGTRVFVHLVYSKGGSDFSVYLRAGNGDVLPGAIQESVNGKRLHFCDERGEHVAAVESPQLMMVVVNHQSADAALDFARFASSVF